MLKDVTVFPLKYLLLRILTYDFFFFFFTLLLVPWNSNSNNHYACPTCSQTTYSNQQNPQNRAQSYYNMPSTSRNVMQQEYCQHTTIPMVNDASPSSPPPPPYHGGRSVAPPAPLHIVDNNSRKQNNAIEVHPPHSVRDD